jgi:hypothetical protein
MERNDTCVMLSKAYGKRRYEKVKCFLSDTNGSKRAHVLKSQMRAMLITFFNIKGTFHSEFIPQGQAINQAYYVEISKTLHEALHR